MQLSSNKHLQCISAFVLNLGNDSVLFLGRHLVKYSVGCLSNFSQIMTSQISLVFFQYMFVSVPQMCQKDSVSHDKLPELILTMPLASLGLNLYKVG